MDDSIQGLDRMVVGLNGGDDGFLFVRFEDFLPDADFSASRPAYSYKVFDEDLVLVYEELDKDCYIRLGAGSTPNALVGMQALLSFLSACAEARDEDSENWDLFPEVVREWAKENDTAIVSAMVEIEAN